MFQFFKKKIDPTAACMEARSLVSNGKVADAIDLLTTVISENPQFSLAYADRGTVYAMTDRHASAAEDLGKALSLGYREGSLFTTLATVQQAQGDLSSSLKSFNEAEALDPSNPFIYYNRAGVYLSLRKKEMAIADLDRCLAFNPDPAFLAAIKKRRLEAGCLVNRG